MRERGAGTVSAGALTSAVRVHADRVHDAVRRQGCAPAAAVQVVSSTALQLVDEAAQHPAPLPVLVGRWFALAQRAAAAAGAHDAYLPVGRGVLADDGQQELLAAGLERRDERARQALLLRDAYDLPPDAVAAALGVSPDQALRLVGSARLALLPDVFVSETPSLGDHPADEAGLARLAGGGAPSADDAATARHVRACAVCRPVVEAQEDVRHLLAGLSVVALPDEAREALLDSVTARAASLLPPDLPADAAESWDEEEDLPRRLLSPAPVLLLLVLAVAGGVGLGAALARHRPAEAAVVNPLPPVTAPPPSSPPPPEEPPAPPPGQAPAPLTSVFTYAPPPSPTPTPARTVVPTTAPPTRSASPTPTPTTSAQVALTPSSGRAGGAITVTGTGWEPDSTVSIALLSPDGDVVRRATGGVDGDGAFEERLSPGGPLEGPGDYTVRVSDGGQTVRATYRAG